MMDKIELDDSIGELSKPIKQSSKSRRQSAVPKDKENSKIKEYRRFIKSRQLSMEVAALQHEILRSKYNKIWMGFVAINILLSSIATILTTVNSNSAALSLAVTLITATNVAVTTIAVSYGIHEKPTQHKTANGTATEISDEIARFLIKRPDIIEMSTFSDVIEEKIKAFRAMEPSVPMKVKHDVARKRLSLVSV